MVSLRLSRQVDAPNQCSSANSLFMSLTWHWHTCIALRVLRCTTQFVTLLATPTAFVRAATCVLRPTSFISSCVPLPLHHVRSYPDASFHGFPPASTQSQHTAGSTFHFAKSTLQYSLGFIIASLRPTFISVGFSPPAANNFACLAYHCLRCGAALTHTYAHALTLTQSHAVHVTFRPFTVRPSFPTVTLLYAPASGARSRRRSFLPLASLTARYAATLQPLLLPAAANASFCRRRFYLFCQRTEKNHQKFASYLIQLYLLQNNKQ